MGEQIILTSEGRLQRRLLTLATLFMLAYAAALTISPAVRARTWPADLRWMHWIGVGAWMAFTWLLEHWLNRRLPKHDPYLLPITSLLAGWGLLTIYRLWPEAGLRQSAWLLGGGLFIAVGIARLAPDLSSLRRYKYVWLSSGLLLTGLTLWLGTNPLGYGPRMWLGCCGFYLQPSEPLKLLLVIYLAAYLAEPRTALPASQHPDRGKLLGLLAPTLVMTGLALGLLLVQRDLGTASIFLFLYTIVVYLSTNRRIVPLSGAVVILAAGVTGMLLFDLVRLRIDAWLNPWMDPTGRSYQIVQSLLAVANGGVFGRGPGLGNPGLVPVPHSDFIFAAITEETGLLGGLALLALLAVLVGRGLLVAIQAPDPFRRLLAGGLTTYLGGQSILIIGGNLRLLPLTGVTLPLVSYGGSSLMISLTAILLLLMISSQPVARPVSQVTSKPYLNLGLLLFSGIAGASLALGWWAVVRSPGLLLRTDNARRVISDRNVRRGSLLDRNLQPINATEGEPGSYVRKTLYPPLSNIVGYTNPRYGQSGLEASLDPYLRGLRGLPGLTIWWNHLLYGEPPPGLDVRLSLDLELQKIADESLGANTGAAILLDASSGEILAMASHPGFDANQLEADWESLTSNPDTPLLNRAIQGSYLPGSSLAPFFLAQVAAQGGLPEHSALQTTRHCALPPDPNASGEAAWGAHVAAGCPDAQLALAKSLPSTQRLELLRNLGFFTVPAIGLEASRNPLPAGWPEAADDSEAEMLGTGRLLTSPLQMARAAAALTNGGSLPALSLATGVNTANGWELLPPESFPGAGLLAGGAQQAAHLLTMSNLEIWEVTSLAPLGESRQAAWYLAGSLPESEAPKRVVVILLEGAEATSAQQAGRAVLSAALNVAISPSP